MQDSTKRKLIDIGAVLLVILCLPILLWLAPRHHSGEVRVIDCSISEISPDFTTAMREACRQARTKKP